ncbi:ABC transporter permease [Bacillus sp. FJAT-42376]|uniref:ABC transporter permease n=1 Tax=Bacillus sp. FJAT-42376 TaxID=2014076 RepID=UPI000F4DD012|nr:ABC transporter permease [Bacillus sp. FJAT-42376]AZB41441.1 ABC transporter permease [Bacillus sp. FJAT-42376]
MFSALFGSVELGVIYAIMALGVYLSFRVLDFPDLTVDGSFVTGAAVAAAMIVLGFNPVAATAASLAAGFAAGCITGVLHTKGKINPLLSGILMMIALYSINLRIMGTTSETSIGVPNIPLLNSETLFTSISDFTKNIGLDAPLNSLLSAIGLGDSLPSTWGILLFMMVITMLIKFLTDFFLKTETGLAIRATGDNQRMIRSFSANTDYLIILGLGLSNALVALSGALVAQYAKFSDIGMGIGMIIIGLASVIIGEAIFGTKTIARTTLAVIGGAVIYRIVITLSLQVKGLDTGDLKLITAVIVIFALVLPKLLERRRQKLRKARRYKERMQELNGVSGKGEAIAASKAD